MWPGSHHLVKKINRGEKLTNDDQQITPITVGYSSEYMLLIDGDLVHAGLAWIDHTNFRIQAYGDAKDKVAREDDTTYLLKNKSLIDRILPARK